MGPKMIKEFDGMDQEIPLVEALRDVGLGMSGDTVSLRLQAADYIEELERIITQVEKSPAGAVVLKYLCN